MRALLGFSVLLAVVLAGCGAPANVSPAAKTSPAAAGAEADPDAPSCQNAQLSARLGARTDLGNGQGTIPLIFTNTSPQPCRLRGAPIVVLHGPADPNGSDYALFHAVDSGRGLVLAPGASGVARLAVLSDVDGAAGTNGSRHWVPTQLETDPFGHGKKTAGLIVPWPAGVSVLRQDGVAKPGSYVEGVKADPTVTG